MFSVESILGYLKKTFTRIDVLVFIGILLLYFVIRLTNLDKWPIFSDEGIYIRWAKVAWKDASWRFISVTDGRQPLQTWATIPFLKLFPENMVLAGRLFSVMTGFIGMSGIFCLLTYLWGKRAGIIGSLLYVCMPYFVFYDRMALVDSAVNAGFIWIFYFSLLLARKRKLETALLFGFIGGFALIAKSSIRIFLMLSAFAPILYLKEKKKLLISNTVNYLVLLGMVFAISLLFYNVQRLSPFFHYVELKNTTFVMTFQEFFQTPFAYTHNFRYIPLYVAWESGWFIIPFSIAGLFLLWKKERLLAFYLTMFIILPYIAVGFFAKILFPRYVLFYGSIVVITAVYFFENIKDQKLSKIMLIALLFSMVVFDYPLLFKPVAASLPPVDRGQYVEGVTAVWGAQDLMEYVRNHSQTKSSLILAEGDFGLVGDVLTILLKANDKIEIKGMWPLEEKHLYEFQPELQKRHVFVVYSHRFQFPEKWPIKLIQKYTKPNSADALYLFELLPAKNNP